jgi:hypothetical protein
MRAIVRKQQASVRRHHILEQSQLHSGSSHVVTLLIGLFRRMKSLLSGAYRPASSKAYRWVRRLTFSSDLVDDAATKAGP